MDTATIFHFDRIYSKMKKTDKIREYILTKTGLPADRTNVIPFYSIYPIDIPGETYDECDIFDPKVVFENVFSYEEYNPEKTYEMISIKPIDEVKGKLSMLECAHLTEKHFVNYFYVAVDILFPNKYRIFVITDEIVRLHEIKLLSKYCQCEICTLPWYIPGKYIACPDCYGCLITQASEIRGYNRLVDITRQFINEQYKATPFL